MSPDPFYLPCLGQSESTLCLPFFRWHSVATSYYLLLGQLSTCIVHAEYAVEVKENEISDASHQWLPTTDSFTVSNVNEK